MLAIQTYLWRNQSQIGLAERSPVLECYSEAQEQIWPVVFFQFRTQDLQVTSPVFIQPLTRGYNFYLAHTLLCATFFFGNTFCHPSLDLGFCQERQQTFFLCWRNALYHCAVIEKFFFNIYCNNNADYQSLYQVMAYLHIKQ